ncbi:hypothetical protein QYE76_055354 [Lolium multiflorum]|uniref:Uncharacterized protein n=1 Tax=Lolium multiflorum TaxID=4521 RepID=A0AAD8WPD7_LOLMU|nr:hypothetical protein QYE76_055354 [Lolium multiflorum]
MIRAHLMWLYLGPKDETRRNIAELSEKELLDEVWRLTHFSQEDSIPLISSRPPFDDDHPPIEIPIVPDHLPDPSNDTSEGRDSSVPVEFHAEENMSPKDERDDPMNPEASFNNPQSPANDISDTAGSMHDDDTDRATFVDAAVEEAELLPSKRSSGGSADEDDLYDLPHGPYVDCFFPFQGEGYSFDCRCCSSSFRETFDKAQLQKEVESSSSKLEGAIKMVAEARQEIDSLKEELEGLKKRLKDEEASRLTAEARAADIPAEALDKLPNNSPANALSMTLASHQLVQDLLQKGKGAMARMHSMIFPKINQDNTLGQLIDAFAVNTKEVIEVFPVPAFVDDSSGALPESDRLQRMKDRIAQMEKNMRNTYALAAIINKKNELAADAERYALTELHRATESFNCYMEPLTPKVGLPAAIIVDRLDETSTTSKGKETPQE